mgnify:CR=1 FL=1
MRTKTFILWIAALLVAIFCWNWVQAETCPKSSGDFIRGDVDGDGVAACVSDAFRLVYFLMHPDGDHLVRCLDAADANDDGQLDISDPIAILRFSFLGDNTIAAPFDCGADPTPDYLGCADSPPCSVD